MKLIIYCRVSTNKQDIGLDAQETQCRAYCSLYSHEVVSVISEKKSASSYEDRSGLQKAISECVSGKADGLLFYSLDRLTRSVKDIGDIIDDMKDKAFVSVMDKFDTTTASGRLVLNIMVSMSQWERERIGERTKMALGELRDTGKVYGPIPYGYARQDGALVPCEREALAIDRAIQIHSSRSSLREISRILHSEGFYNRQGKPFEAQQVKRMIDNGPVRKGDF